MTDLGRLLIGKASPVVSSAILAHIRIAGRKPNVRLAANSYCSLSIKPGNGS
jgi:hypothetical protein